MKDALGLFFFALGMFVNAYSANPAQPPVARATVNPYAVAESFGCTEVTRVCYARRNSARTSERHRPFASTQHGGVR